MYKKLTKWMTTFVLTCYVSVGISCEIKGGERALQPGSWIQVVNSGFDVDTPDSLLWAMFDFGDDQTVVPAFLVPKSGFEFVVPPTMYKPWEDKAIKSLWITNGEVGCEIKGLTHRAMEQNPRLLQHLIGLTGNNYAALSADMGFSQDEINQAVLNTASVQQNPVLAYSASLFHLLPYFKELYRERQSSKEIALALDVMDAYIASTGILDRLEELDKINQEFIEEANTAGQLFSERHLLFASANRVNPLYDYSNLKTITRPIETNWAEPKSANELAMQMRKQYRASLANSTHKNLEKGIFNPNSLTGLKTSVLRDSAGTVLGLGGLLASQAGGAAGKPIAFGYSMAAHHLFMQAFGDKLVDGLYPSKFESISVQGGPWRIYTQKRPKRTTVNKIMVTTSAKGLNMAQLLVDIINNFFPYGKAIGSAGAKLSAKVRSAALKKVGPKLGSRFSQLRSQSIKSQREALSSVAEGTEALGKQVLSQQIGDAKFDGPLSAFKISKFNLPPINILEKGFYHAALDTKSTLLPSFTNQPTLLFYDAKKAGDAVLTYRPMPGLWGNNEISGTQLIQVDPDDLWVSPSTQTILPGQLFSVTVTHSRGDTRASDVDLDITLSDGFKVSDLSEPLLAVKNGTPIVSWVVTIQSPSDKGKFSGTILVKRFSAPNQQAKARVDAPQIYPRPFCVDQSTVTQFNLVDENNASFSEISWESSPLGRISKNGSFTSGDIKGNSIITAKTTDGVLVDELELTVGCSCYWRLDLDGMQDQGKIISSGGANVGPVSTFLVNFIDAEKLVPAITGQGTLKSPSTVSVTVQKGETSYLSGLPVNTNILSGVQGRQCVTPSNRLLDWSIHNDRWLSANIIGSAANHQELGSACIKNVVPFSLQFMLDIAGSVEKNEPENADIESLFGALLGGLNTESGCLAIQESN